MNRRCPAYPIAALPSARNSLAITSTWRLALEHAESQSISSRLIQRFPKMRSAGKEVLEILGYHVLEASNGLKAVDMFTDRQQDISLIIMDVIMPVLGGVQAVERIRDISPEAQVIFAYRL